MNEVALHRGRYPHLSVVDAFVNGQHLTEAVVRGASSDIDSPNPLPLIRQMASFLLRPRAAPPTRSHLADLLPTRQSIHFSLLP
jgi:NADH kinase